MPKITGSRFFAEATKAYGLSHVFFMPTILTQAMAEMEDMKIMRVTTHGEKAAACMADGYTLLLIGRGYVLPRMSAPQISRQGSGMLI